MKLASSLLKEDGVIYISINEEEYANLKLLCDSCLLYTSGREFGFDGTYSSLGRHLLHHFSDDDVYQQYSYGCADGSY